MTRFGGEGLELGLGLPRLLLQRAAEREVSYGFVVEGRGGGGVRGCEVGGIVDVLLSTEGR